MFVKRSEFEALLKLVNEHAIGLWWRLDLAEKGIKRAEKKLDDLQEECAANAALIDLVLDRLGLDVEYRGAGYELVEREGGR